MTVCQNKEPFEPIDIIAVLLLGGGLILHAMGKGEVIVQMMLAIVFYYFGKREIKDDNQ